MLRAHTMLRLKALKQHLSLSSNVLLTHNNGTDVASEKTGYTKAVIFDMGGVILPGPFQVFKAFEDDHGIASGTIIKAVVSGGNHGAWARLERGELTVPEFAETFSEECSKVAGCGVNITGLMERFLPSEKQTVAPYPEVIEAIKCIQAEGIKTALLTNNWMWNIDSATYNPISSTLFDVVVESSKVGMRKPEPRIYDLILKKLEVQPHEAIFLDDLGSNLKIAKTMGIRTIKVNDPVTAILELQTELRLDLRCYINGTVAVPKRLELDIEKLTTYLNWVLKLRSKDSPIVRCFEHGHSNPTYFIRYANKDMVLRKKPPGKLLPSAHAVEREYRVMKALAAEGIPVPKMLSLCEDSNVLGTPFYLMDHIPGRIFKDGLLPGYTSEERRDIYNAMCDVLAKIHRVDIDHAQLGNYGKKGSYLKRNFERWAKQYESSATEDIPAMNDLMKWLPERIPTEEKVSIVHGDFRLDNLIFHPTKPEVVAVIDWELSTIGDPLTDLANNCMPYYMPHGIPHAIQVGFDGMEDFASYGIPTKEEYVERYFQKSMILPTHFECYIVFIFFRTCAIMQGVYKRAQEGQASSSTSHKTGVLAKFIAEIGWNIASKSNIHTNSAFRSIKTGDSSGNRNYTTDTRLVNMSQNYTTNVNRNIPGSLPLSPSALSPRAYNIYKRMISFIEEHVIPFEPILAKWNIDPEHKWTVHPQLEKLKVLAKAEGLWNLFLPKESDPECKYGAGLSNVEYAYMCEEMGKHPASSEIFNCSAPDTGNMEVLVRYGTDDIKQQWLLPLLNGDIRSCFGMTEPAVASSDATNIQTSIKKEGDHYIINGHKWWTSGAMDPRCRFVILMGKTRTDGPMHQQQSMIIVPMNAPGIKILRNLSVFGYDDSPHGHAEILFENVKVPVSHILLGEGRGFEIAQGRLGPGRIHHCMRLIGTAERALSITVERVQNRVAFGKPLAAMSSIQQDIAKSRLEIEQCRLLVLKAAHLMDTVGNKVAAPEISMIKVIAPNMAQNVIDRSIQIFGGMGVCQDTPLPYLMAHARTLRLADGPDEVHMRSIAKMEIRSQNMAKL